jgi:hypothetical protein
MYITGHIFFFKSSKDASLYDIWLQELNARAIIDEKLNYENAGEGKRAINNFTINLKRFFGIEKILDSRFVLWKNGLLQAKDEDFVIVGRHSIKFLKEWLESDSLIFKVL